MKTLKGVVNHSQIKTAGTANNPNKGDTVKIAATDGGTVIRQWKSSLRSEAPYIAQVFLSGGDTVIEMFSDEELE